MQRTTPKALFLSSLLAGLFALSAQAQPTLVSADPHGNANGIVVVYSTAMDPASSANIANYILTNAAGSPVAVSGAVLQVDQVTVRLALGSSMVPTTNYTLVISNVKDAGLNTITPNPTLASFFLCGPPGGTSFTFDDGLVPTNTSLATSPPRDNAINPFESITNSGGLNNSGCLVLLSNLNAAQTYGQWQITNDLANGSAVSSFNVSFKFWMVNKDTSVALGNGMIFHVGPQLPSQYTGGASSWGNGLDLNFRNFANGIIPIGVNIWWYPPYTEPTTAAWQNQAGGGTIPSQLPLPAGLVNLNTNWIGYLDTNGPSGDFSNYVSVNFSVSNGVANLICSNAQIGSMLLFSNVAIPNWQPIIGGTAGSGLPANFGFTSTDGAGNHQMVVVDDVDLTVNGVHVAGNGTVAGCGPVAFQNQPVSVTTNENVYVNFSAGATGAGPFTWQWFSNSVAISGATGASYRTPLTLYSNTLNGIVNYSVVVSNDFSFALSSNAVLTVIQDTSGVQVLSVGSQSGSTVGVVFSSFVDLTTAGNPANYLVNGVQPSAATVRTAFANFGDPVLNYAQYQKTVLLTPASPVSGSFNVTVKNGVRSRTSVPVVQTNLNGTVAGLLDVDLGGAGTDPFAAGETFVGGTGQAEIIAGGSDMMAIAAGGTSDHAHYAYIPRTGNFDVVAKVTWETPTMTAAKAGLMVRTSAIDPNDGSDPAISETVFPLPGRNSYETAARTNYADRAWSWAAPGVAANGNVGAAWPGANWIRIRRLGPTFAGFASGANSDGTPSAWNLIGLVTPDTGSFPALEYIGPVATAANNDGRLCEADFSNFGPLVFAGATLTITNNLHANYAGFANAKVTFPIGVTVSGLNVFQSDIAYQWQRAEPSTPTVFNDILDGTGNTNTYTTPLLTVANDNGAKYRVIAFVGDLTTGHSVTSIVATLNVSVDITPPFMTAAAANSSFLSVSINFDGPIDPTSASTTGNYTLVPVGGGSALTIDAVTAVVSADGITYTNVVLAIDAATPLLAGVKYTLTVSNVLDTANNNINDTVVAGGRQRIVTGWVLALGYLKYERFYDSDYVTPGGFTDLAHLLNNPSFQNNRADVTELVTYSGYPNGDLSNPNVSITDFGSRLSGYVIPPTNGNYNFYLRGNDGTVLFVSSSATPPDPNNDNAKAVADNTSNQSWLYSVTNAILFHGVFIDTNAMSLTAGQPYAVTLLEKQGTGTSWEEFTWGNPTNPAMPTLTSTTTAYGPPTQTGRGGAPTNAYSLTGTNIATYVNPDTSIITASGPTNMTVVQYRFGFLAVASASAVVSAGGAPSPVPVTYQWLSNGIPVAGATNATYTTPMLTDTNHTILYGAKLSVSGLTFMTITNTAVVTVVPDTTPPTVLSASSLGGNTIGIRYQEFMDAASVTNAANYTGVTGGLTVTKVLLRSDLQTVLLYLSGTLSGNTFSVTINNVKDIGGNPIAANTVATGNVVFGQMTALDIGVGTNALGAGVVQTNTTLTNVTFDVNFPGSTVAAQDGVFETVASGADIGSQQDGMHFLYEQRTGDFDVKVRVERIDGSSAQAKAGLLLRADLTPGALEYLISVGPAATNAADGSGIGFNGVTLLRRQTNNAGVTALANNPAPPVLGNFGAGATNMYPVWLRLRRTGSSFYFYTGADGTNWYLGGRATGQTTWPLTTYVGMATTAANKSSYTQSRFTQYGNYVAPAIKQVLLVGLDNSIPGSGPIDTPAGNPNAPSLWLAADLYMYNLFLSLGYGVTVVPDATARLEDATGMSLIFWDGTTSSANIGGTPSTFTWAPVPIVQAKDATLEKLGWVKTATDRGGVINQSQIKIVHTNNPIVRGLYQTNQNVIVNSSAQSFAVAITNNPGISGLAPAFTVVATITTNSGLATIYYADKSATGLWWNSPSNYVAHRRVGLWLGDGNNTGFGSGHNGGAPVGDVSTVTSDGSTLLLNAINWAVATNEPPYITNGPANQTVAVGNSATFAITPGGPGPYTFQWYKNNLSSPISGANYADYVTPATVLGDSGSTFQVVLTGLSGSVTSTVATLTVLAQVGISAQPQNARVAVNHSATFAISATGGGTITYQWFSNAVLVAGATAASYTTPGLPLSANGSLYYVTVANQVSSLNSATATVTVVNPPVIGLTNHTLTWSGGGNLEAATNVIGPYTNVPGAASPYTFTVIPGVPTLFFRVQQ